jgi:hypothetical protein
MEQFGCFYVKNPSPRAALLAILFGALTRVILEFTLPKDKSLLLPYNYDEYYAYGTAASANLPTFVDPGDGDIPQWDPSVETCEQTQFEDYTGVDSLSAFLMSIVVFCTVQYWEILRNGKPLFTYPGMEPYFREEFKEEIDDPTVKMPTEPQKVEAPREDSLSEDNPTQEVQEEQYDASSGLANPEK